MTSPFGCIFASGRLDREGYAFHGKTRAHIHAWECVNGVRPEGMELDHLCRNRNCIALHHLELVTRSENEKRKSLKHRMKWKCPHGHQWPINRVVTNAGGVVCRQCNRDADADGDLVVVSTKQPSPSSEEDLREEAFWRGKR